MKYTIYKNNPQGFFMELADGTYRTKILFNFTPDDTFYGVAVGCSYLKNNHPVGYLKDNDKLVTQIPGKEERPYFTIGGTVIQAGPTLIKDKIPLRRKYTTEGFSSHDVVAGIHCHIGRKKSNNLIIGMTREATFSDIVTHYEEFHCENAIKLAGLKSARFYFRSRIQKIQEGEFPFPVALVFQSLLEK